MMVRATKPKAARVTTPTASAPVVLKRVVKENKFLEETNKTSKYKRQRIRRNGNNEKERPYVCLYGCPYKTDRPSHLQRHHRTHTKEKPFICTYKACSYRSATKCQLVRHIRV